MLEKRVTYLLHRVAEAAGRKANAALAPLDLDARHYSVLALLETNAAPSQRFIADVLGIDRATLVALADDLTALGMVQRVQSTRDRRANRLDLTEKGQQIVAQAHTLMDTCEQNFLHALPADDRDQLASVLNRLRAANV